MALRLKGIIRYLADYKKNKAELMQITKEEWHLFNLTFWMVNTKDALGESQGWKMRPTYLTTIGVWLSKEYKWIIGILLAYQAIA